LLAGSNYKISFQNVPTGSHSLRIVAENNKKDKLVMKIKIYVSGTDTSTCAVNLVNNRITYMDNSAMIYFKGTNSANKFSCRLNRQAAFECKFLHNYSRYPPSPSTHSIYTTPPSFSEHTMTAYYIGYSPLFLRRLETGKHRVEITPTSDWCEHRTPLTHQFLVT